MINYDIFMPVVGVVAFGLIGMMLFYCFVIHKEPNVYNEKRVHSEFDSEVSYRTNTDTKELSCIENVILAMKENNIDVEWLKYPFSIKIGNQSLSSILNKDVMDGIGLIGFLNKYRIPYVEVEVGKVYDIHHESFDDNLGYTTYITHKQKMYYIIPDYYFRIFHILSSKFPVEVSEVIPAAYVINRLIDLPKLTDFQIKTIYSYQYGSVDNVCNINVDNFIGKRIPDYDVHYDIFRVDQDIIALEIIKFLMVCGYNRFFYIKSFGIIVLQREMLVGKIIEDIESFLFFKGYSFCTDILIPINKCPSDIYGHIPLHIRDILLGKTYPEDDHKIHYININSMLDSIISYAENSIQEIRSSM